MSDPVESKLVNFEEIHRRYAKRYDLGKFKGYMKTILKNYKDGTQEFVKKDDIEPWTSRSKKSRICKTFVIPYQYPTLILVRSDLTFTVSDPKKMHCKRGTPIRTPI
jgi:hypothetical protein